MSTCTYTLMDMRVYCGTGGKGRMGFSKSDGEAGNSVGIVA
jgi:hypothetical protein